MKKRPIIGITTDTVDDKPAYYLSYAYADAIEKAGGLPLAIPYRSDLSLIPQFVDAVDGILFTGGNDLDPATYGQTLHPSAVPIEPDRQKFETALLEEVERRKIPTLCICLGFQLLNVHRGGSLHQFLPDLPDKSEHRRIGQTLLRHAVTIDPNSQLAAAVGSTEISANTYHKQAVNRPGRDLRIVATAPDGTIEGMEDPNFPMLLAVQWHPERLADEPEHLGPFKMLIEKARAGG